MRKRIFIVAAVTAIGLTGCASVPSLSEQQNDAIAEYMADNLLKYDKNYSSTVKLNSSVETATPEPSVQPSVSPNVTVAPASTMTPAGTDTTDQENTAQPGATSAPENTYVSLSDAMQVPGFKVKFSGYKCSTNISTDVSNISSKAGKKLFVVKMKLKNDTDVTKKIDMTKNNSVYSLSIDGNQMDQPLLTIAGNDIHFIKKKVAANKSENAILVFEIPSNTKIKNVVLEVTNNDAVAQLNIK